MDVYVADHDYKQQREFYYGFFSDLHLESKTHERTQLDRDIEEVLGYNARIYIGGDIAELIMPGDVKRYTRGRDQIDSDAQLNEITRVCYEWMRPYADHIDWIGFGNHEESALKHNNYDITLGVITLLNRDRSDKLPPIHHGGYRSFIRWRYRWGTKHSTRTVTALHFHGKGSSAPVTKGMIDISRVMRDFDADIYWLGHKHTSITDKPQQVYLDQRGNICAREKRAFFTAGYQGCYAQEDYSDGYRISYEDRHLTTTTIGHALLRVSVDSNGNIAFRVTQ